MAVLHLLASSSLTDWGTWISGAVHHAAASLASAKPTSGPTPSLAPSSSPAVSATPGSQVSGPAQPGQPASTGITGLAGTGIGGLAVGAGATWYAMRRRVSGRRQQTTPTVAPDTGADAARAWDGAARDRPWNAGPGRGVSPDGGTRTTEDRGELINSVIDLADRLRDRQPGLWKAANRHLADVGVQAYEADGEAFDPARHHAVGYQETGVARDHLKIASTERCGYSDHGQVLRAPDVIVYRVMGDERVP
jgi:hypothetical protein